MSIFITYFCLTIEGLLLDRTLSLLLFTIIIQDSITARIRWHCCHGCALLTFILIIYCQRTPRTPRILRTLRTLRSLWTLRALRIRREHPLFHVSARLFELLS